MNDLKYLIFIPKGCSNEISSRAIVFNGMVTHATIKEALEKEGHKVTGGGFCTVITFNMQRKPRTQADLKVWGKCTSIPMQGTKSGFLECDELLDKIFLLQTLSRQPGPLF